MKIITLEELGQQLPIGVPAKGKLLKDFDLRAYKARVDRHLGEWQEANQGKYSPGQMVACKAAKFLSLIVAKYGGFPMSLTESGNSSPESELAVYNWFFADVMYVYLYKRVQMEPGLPVPFKCPICGIEKEVTFDLRKVEVKVLEKFEELEEWVSVKEPFPLRADSGQCRKAKVTPPRWSTMTEPGVMAGDMGRTTYASMKSAIIGVNGSEAPYTLVDSELDEMSKIDLERFNRVPILTCGPLMATPLDCPIESCRGRIIDALDWSHEHFFERSLVSSVT